MLALCQGPCESPAQLEQISGPNTTHLLLQGPLEQHARLWLPDTLVTDRPPEDTLLLPSDQITLPSHYRRGVIGRRDRTMEPMIRPGSIVLIDIQKRAIAGRKEWNNEFDRPIYFLFTRAGYRLVDGGLQLCAPNPADAVLQFQFAHVISPVDEVVISCECVTDQRWMLN
jgi:hypothetical protein